MGIRQNSVAAATAIVGYDLADGQRWQRQGYGRNIKLFALKGSAAEGDTEVEIFIGDVYIGNMFNTGTGFPNVDDLIPFGEPIPVPPYEDIHIFVKDAPATNPINVLLVD